MDIIIFGGQSNMQGESESLTRGITEEAYEYKYLDDSIVELQNPVGENIRYDGTAGRVYQESDDFWVSEHVLGGACFGNTNLVPKFCEYYREQTQTKVLAVHVAKGSTQIKDWLPETDGYEMLVKKASAAITYKTTAYYKENITILNDTLKKELGIEKFGIIRVGRFVNDERDDRIITAQDEICEENDDFLMLTTIATDLNTKPEHMNPTHPGHFGTKGLELLGEKAGETLGKYAKKTITSKNSTS